MARGYALHLSVEALEKRGVALGELTGEALGKVVVNALNEVVDSAYDLSRKRMITGINLTDAYLRRKMVLTHATAAKPVSSIQADGNKKDAQTTLSHFRVVQKERNVTWSNSRILGMGKKFSNWPGWTERTGNTPLGIAPNRKANGLSATVKDARDGFQHAFSIVQGGSAIRDGDGAPIMFTRSKGGERNSTRALLGPAVYQLFKYQLNGTLLEEAEQELADTLVNQVEAAMLKVLS